MDVTFRRLDSLEDYRACERLQRQAWGFEDALDVIPQTQLVTAQKYGGLVLGAFDDEGDMLGFCYGFLGRDPRGRLVHCSHMLAVAERARNSGLGARLKWEQRRVALAQGLDLMVWTYDPLESVNACLNFGKLGGVADSYTVNLYGETTSRLHAGTATDRLTLKWFLRSGRVVAREPGGEAVLEGEDVGRPGQDGSPEKAGTGSPDKDRNESRRDPVAAALADGSIDAPWILQARRGEARPEHPADPDLELAAHRLRLEIPGSVQEVKERDPAAAVAWREATRAAFTSYLERGWFVRECLRTRVPGEPRRTVYLLESGTCEPDGLSHDSHPTTAIR